MKNSALDFEKYDKGVRWTYALAAVCFVTGIGIPISLFLVGYGLGLSKGKTRTLKIVEQEIEE